MKVDIAELREVAAKLFDHFEKSGIRSFELVHDHYWEVPAAARYNVYEQPTQLDIGQLTDDLVNLRSLHVEPTIGYAGVWLGAILREIGEQEIG